MENIQVNGQRICGPPKNWSGPPPPHGTEIFIKNIPEKIMEKELFHVFSTVGEVYQVRVPIYWNGLNRGYAFVRYTKTEYATAAIKHLNRLQIQIGSSIKVEMSVDNNRLFLSAVQNDKSEDDIMEDLRNVVENVKRVYVYPSFTDPSLYRGYAFVEFVSHRDAAIAKRVLTPEVCASLFEKNCIAAWANPLPMLHDDILEKISILFMRNIPQGISESLLKDSVQVMTGFNLERVKKLNDIAFLTFKTHAQAKRALEIMKINSNFLGSTTMEVEWAVPREMARSKISAPDLDFTKSTKQDKETDYHVKYLSSPVFRNNLQNFMTPHQNIANQFEAENSIAPEWIEDPIKNFVGSFQKKNINSKFINNILIPFTNFPNDLSERHNDSGFSEEFLIQSADDIRLDHLNYWFDTINFGSDSLSSLDSCPSPTNSSCYEKFQPFRKAFRDFKQKRNNLSIK